MVEHHIDTGSDHLSLLFLYRALAIENETISSLIIEMLQSSVIRRSQAHRASFIMLVIKSDDIVRIYVHCRRLNVKTTKGVCPLTFVDDTFYSLDNAKCFSTIGLISSYWQIKSHSKCSFISGWCLFEFVRMSFGICSPPANMQRLTNSVLTCLKWKTCILMM